MKAFKATKLLALLLACLLLVSVFAACGEEDKPVVEDVYEGADTLVIGYSNFSEKFSPFFGDSAYDVDVYAMTSIGLLGSDREGNIILKGIEGETIPYNGTDYLYTGMADCVITENSDETVDYDITIRDDIKFSDGSALTLDDVLFNMYVYSDPTYDGSSTFYTLPIEGMEEYRAGMSVKWNIISDAYIAANCVAADVAESEFYTADDVAAFEAALPAAAELFAADIVSYCMTNYAASYAEAYSGYTADELAANEGLSTMFGMVMWGYGAIGEDGTFTSAVLGKEYDLTTTFPTAADYGAEILEAYGYNLSADDGLNYEAANASFESCITSALAESNPSLNAGVTTGESAPNIKGIIKTGDNSLRLHLTKVDATAIYKIAIPVSPMYYYGDGSEFDYDNNKFGFTKGDLSCVKDKTTFPVGAGAYKFVSYENGVVTFEKNDLYYKGAPKITNVLFRESSDADKLTGVATGTLDVSDPSISADVVKSIKEYNGNDSTDGDCITTNTVDNLGYGYIGICAKTVNVGGVADSKESKDLRKAFATLMAAYRDSVINSYYGERASVIQYPISNTSWAAPKPADEGYEIAYSKDVDGKDIYTDDMNDEQKFEAALQAAVGYFKAAGYTWDEASGKFTAAPDGADLSYEVMIPGDGVGDHPAFGIMTAASDALATIGIDLQITDLSNSSVLWDALDAQTCEIWTAAWQATVDPDMYQTYFSTNAVGLGGTDSNHYCIADAQLDELILEARSSIDQPFRKATYKQCLDIILDWACEVPTYQRQNAIIFSTERVKMDTVTPDITTFWGWMNDIELLEMNPVAA